MATAQQIANAITPLSTRHRIIRYLVKMWNNRNNPAWQNDFVVRKVFYNGEIDVDKVRQHFIDRGICTDIQFNNALQAGITVGILTADLKATSQLLIDVEALLEEQVEIRRQELLARYPSVRMPRFTQAELDYVNFITDTLI